MNEKGIENVSVKDVLLEIRTYRMGLIQTPDQLRFSYIALIQGLKVDWTAHDDVLILILYFSYLKRNAQGALEF